MRAAPVPDKSAANGQRSILEDSTARAFAARLARSARNDADSYGRPTIAMRLLELYARIARENAALYR